MQLHFDFICGSILLLQTFQLATQNDISAPPENYTDHYTELKDYLFGDGKISTSKRPVLNHNTTVQVQGLLVILQVVDLDERTGTLITNGQADFRWTDEQIKWNPENYGGLKMLEIPDKTVWKPDFAIINSVELAEMFKYGKGLVIVTAKGVVYWTPPFTSKSSCPMDHKKFPFDQHICHVEIGSWSYHSKQLNFSHISDFHPQESTMEQFRIPNPKWEMTLLPAETDSIEFECCPGYSFPYIRQSILLKRRSPLYKFSFVAPTVMSVIITLAIFWLPVGQRDRLLVSGLAVIVQVIILMTLRATIPAGGTTVPHIMLFCGNSFIMSCMSIVITVILRRLSTQRTYIPLPSTIKNALNGVLGKILCLNTNASQDNDSVLSERKVHGDVTVETGTDSTNNKSSQFNDMMLLANAINNVCFIVYCFTFITIIIASFA